MNRAMSEPLGIALRGILEGLAQAHEGNRLPLALAWHNLFVVNQLALVCVHWHRLVNRYSYHDAFEAVHALFYFAAKKNLTGLLTSKRWNELPMEFQFQMFTNHIFDNCVAIAKFMNAWRANSHTRRHGPDNAICRSSMTKVDAWQTFVAGVQERSHAVSHRCWNDPQVQWKYRHQTQSQWCYSCKSTALEFVDQRSHTTGCHLGPKGWVVDASGWLQQRGMNPRVE